MDVQKSNNNALIKNIIWKRKRRQELEYKDIKELYQDISNKIIIHYDKFIDRYLMFDSRGHISKYLHIRMTQFEYLLLVDIFEKVDYANFNVFEPYCGGFLDLMYNNTTLLTLTIEDDEEFGYNYVLWINSSNPLCMDNVKKYK